jgi:hypothetical protein
VPPLDSCVYGSATRLRLSSIALGAADCRPAYRRACDPYGRTSLAAGSPVEPREQGDREARGPALVAEVSAAEPDAASSFGLARAEQPHPQTAQAQSLTTLRHTSNNQRLRRRGHREVFEPLRLSSPTSSTESGFAPRHRSPRRLVLMRNLEHSKQAYPSCKGVSILVKYRLGTRPTRSFAPSKTSIGLAVIGAAIGSTTTWAASVPRHSASYVPIAIRRNAAAHSWGTVYGKYGSSLRVRA